MIIIILDTIDDRDSFEVVPDSRFVVSRTAFKDNSSNYAIDGKKHNFKVHNIIIAVIRYKLYIRKWENFFEQKGLILITTDF